MPINNEFEITDDIAVETEQSIANLNDQIIKLIADVADIRSNLNS